MKLQGSQGHLSMDQNGMVLQLCRQSHHLDFFATAPLPQSNGETTSMQQENGYLKEMEVSTKSGKTETSFESEDIFHEMRRKEILVPRYLPPVL